MRRLAGLAGAAALLATAGCGHPADAVSDRATTVLEPHVAALRAAAAADPTTVPVRVAALRQAVAALRQEADLTESAAAQILGEADSIEAAARALITTTTALPTRATAVVSGSGGRESGRTGGGGRKGGDRKHDDHD